MDSKRKLENKHSSPKKRRNTKEKIADAYSLDIENISSISLPKIKRHIGSTRWHNGHLILDEESKKINGKKHLLIETHYVWDHTVKFPNHSLLSMWVFAIISIYNKNTNSFLRKNVTVNIDKQFSEKYYNHFKFRKIKTDSDSDFESFLKKDDKQTELSDDEKNEVFDDKDN